MITLYNNIETQQTLIIKKFNEIINYYLLNLNYLV